MSKILLEADTSTLEKNLTSLGVASAYIKKLVALGEPFKKACQVLGYNIKPINGGNPLLAFVLQQKQLVNSGLLNANTFKALYNAVAKELVADSEFFTTNDYNIIYCKNLYKKPPTEIEEYLVLQKKVLNPNEQEYSLKNQLDNRKTFLYISGIERAEGQEELNIVKRAIALKGFKNVNRIPTVHNAVLNDLKLIEQIVEKSNYQVVSQNADELDKIVAKLTDLASKFAVILMLCTKSTKIKQVLARPEFSELNQQQIANAFMKLAKDGTIPRGHLKEADADLLIKKIAATLEPKEVQEKHEDAKV